LKKETIKINENNQNENILAIISQSDMYKEAYEKKDRFANSQLSMKRKSQSTINKENN
jgi:hypothetical protein